MQHLGRCLALLAMLTLGASVAVAAVPVQLFSDGLSAQGGWSIAATADTAYQFGYDYSADGIPAAPNGLDTIGLKMEANITTGTASQIAAVHTMPGYVSGMPYTVQVDIWANYELGSGSSTEFAGAGIGHDGVTAGLNGASLIYTGDGGSSRDYRLYKDGGEQFIASLQYNPILATNNAAEPAIAAAFPAIDVATATSPSQQIGTTADGNGGFQWMTMLIAVDPTAIGAGVTSDPGLASFTLASAASGNTLYIGTIDNSNGGTVVNMEGDVSLIYADLFTSIATAPQFQFGVYDNVVVTMLPEPATLSLLALGGLALLRRRR